MIKTELFFQLLVSLLANPSGLDGGRQLLTLVTAAVVRQPPARGQRRALSFPFVRVRQLMFCHVASASTSSAAIDRMIGICR